MFDSGAHMLNTISDLATEEFETVWAVISNEGSDVDITGMVMGRLVSGTLVTINACGNTVPSCASDIRVPVALTVVTNSCPSIFFIK